MPRIEKCARRVIELYNLECSGGNNHQVTQTYDSNGFFLGSSYKVVRPSRQSETSSDSENATQTGALGYTVCGRAVERDDPHGPIIIGRNLRTPAEPSCMSSYVESPMLAHDLNDIPANLEKIYAHYPSRAPYGPLEESIIYNNTESRRRKEAVLLAWRLRLVDEESWGCTQSLTSAVKDHRCSVGKEFRALEQKLGVFPKSLRSGVDDFFSISKKSDATIDTFDDFDSDSEPALLTPSRMSTPTFLREEDRCIAAGYYGLRPCVAHQTRECYLGECSGCASPADSTTTSCPEQYTEARNGCGRPGPSEETVRLTLQADKEQERIIMHQTMAWRHPLPDYDVSSYQYHTSASETMSLRCALRERPTASEATLD